MKSRWPGALPLLDAAEYLGYTSVDVVEKLLREGSLRAIQIYPGADRRIPKKLLDDLIEDRLKAPVIGRGVRPRGKKAS